MALSTAEQQYNMQLNSLSRTLLFLQGASQRLDPRVSLSLDKKITLPKPTIELFGRGSRSDFDKVLELLSSQVSLVVRILEEALHNIISSIIGKAPTDGGSHDLLYRYINKSTTGGYSWLGLYSTALQFGEEYGGDRIDEYSDHCNGIRFLDKEPSKPMRTRYISATTSPSRLWNLMGKNPARDGRSVVVVIDQAKLREFGTTFNPAKKIGMDVCRGGGVMMSLNQQNRLNNTNCVYEEHILISDWVPAEAVVSVMDVGQFKRAWQEQAEIGEQKYPCIDYERRLTLDKIQKDCRAADQLGSRCLLHDLHQLRFRDEIQYPKLRIEHGKPQMNGSQIDDLDNRLENVVTEFRESNIKANACLERIERARKSMCMGDDNATAESQASVQSSVKAKALTTFQGVPRRVIRLQLAD